MTNSTEAENSRKASAQKEDTSNSCQTNMPQVQSSATHIASTNTGSSTTITLTQADGSVYVGQVVKQGFGTETDCYGNTYEGQFSQDFKHGQGKMRFIDGSSYEGSWLHGKFNG